MRSEYAAYREHVRIPCRRPGEAMRTLAAAREPVEWHEPEIVCSSLAGGGAPRVGPRAHLQPPLIAVARRDGRSVLDVANMQVVVYIFLKNSTLVHVRALEYFIPLWN